MISQFSGLIIGVIQISHDALDGHIRPKMTWSPTLGLCADLSGFEVMQDICPGGLCICLIISDEKQDEHN